MCPSTNEFTRRQEPMHVLHSQFALTLLASALLIPGCRDDNSRDFSVTVENLSTTYDFLESGANSTPVGADEAGPVTPGDEYAVTFAAPPGSRLSFATMFVMSNDFFYAPDPDGIPLFDDNGVALSGDITNLVYLWDAGTERNQEPGNGIDQAPRQPAPNTGPADPNPVVRLATDDFGNLPTVGEVIRVELVANAANQFTLRIQNVSTPTTLQFSGGQSAVFIAPVAWAIHTEPGAFFTTGNPAPAGLEAHAEDGDPTGLVASLVASTGLTSPIAPGAFAVHEVDLEPFFSTGAADRGEGMEALAEDGDPAQLAKALYTRARVSESGVFNTPEGEPQPGVAVPGQRYEFKFRARVRERLSLATMLVQSNDLFFSFGPQGLKLFDENNKPISGDVTNQIRLWDVGTETNEFPGAGPNQAPRQRAPNTGIAETGVVAPVSDDFEYPRARDVVRITITPL